MDGMDALDAVEVLRMLAAKWEADAAPLTHHGEEYDGAEEERDDAIATTLLECADAVLVAIGDREDESSASRQHYIDTGRHLPTGPACSECDSTEVEEYGMCASCIHDARRSGWEPGA